MKLQFLWDEEKTRQLHKGQLLVFIVGPIFVFLYVILVPHSTPHRLALAVMGALMLLTAIVNLIFIKRRHQGIRLLALILIAQTIGPAYMAFSGGFNSVVGFAPFAIFYMSIYQLGAGPGTLVGIYTAIIFVFMQLWMIKFAPQSVSWANFLFYMGNFTIAIFALRFVGKQLAIQFEAKRKLEQVDDIKNQFITLSSHYLRTPLTVIQNYLTQLGSTVLDQNQRQQLSIIENSSRGLGKLVEKLLAIASIERGRTKIVPQNADLNEMLEGLVKSYDDAAKQKHVTLAYQHIGEIPQFLFDTVKLKEALGGIIDNAIKFNRSDGNVLISAVSQRGNVNIQIKDSGVGINKDHLETLFSSFNRGSMEETLKTDRPGMGLSLYLTKLIVEAHGGKITVESTEGQGSTFTITLPAKTPQTTKI